MYVSHDLLLDARDDDMPGPDYLEAGSGPLVILVHSSMAGARQWSALMAELEPRFRVRAVNLFGYGETKAWAGDRPPSLDEYARLVAAAVPDDVPSVMLVGHSLGGAVAMKAAALHLEGRVTRLVLIEPSPFSLLDVYGRQEAFYEILGISERTSRDAAGNAPEGVAERFVDYWNGPGTWAASSPGRQAAMLRSMTQLPNEWHAIFDDRTRLGEWRMRLPSETLLLSFAGSVRPSRELVEVLSDACLGWEVATIREGGHMGPLTHAHLVNPVIREFLSR